MTRIRTNYTNINKNIREIRQFVQFVIKLYFWWLRLHNYNILNLQRQKKSSIFCWYTINNL